MTQHIEIRDKTFTYKEALDRALRGEKDGWRLPTIHELAALASERPFASAMSNGDPCMAFWSSTPSRLDAAGGYKFCWNITPVAKPMVMQPSFEQRFEVRQHTVLLRAEKQARLVMVR